MLRYCPNKGLERARLRPQRSRRTTESLGAGPKLDQRLLHGGPRLRDTFVLLVPPALDSGVFLRSAVALTCSRIMAVFGTLELSDVSCAVLLLLTLVFVLRSTGSILYASSYLVGLNDGDPRRAAEAECLKRYRESSLQYVTSLFAGTHVHRVSFCRQSSKTH